ncbi:2OG-Fe(II) oxygenase [Nocardia miyunensis]|uniref:2OG-Fe(II) oxygenase n=1 Tax=Nocardia miyunensis TaxID=282684 RepID=UPI0008314C6E|nr:2OG-Fe(II) oxygenase [Nocardia miyunensis]
MIDGHVVAIRIEDFFSPDAARTLTRCLHRLSYERDEIADQKRVSRAARDGDLPDAALIASAETPEMTRAVEILNVFENPWLIARFDELIGARLRVLRPPTPYRMECGDFIQPHDDHPSPEYRLSVACNLTEQWRPPDGGETVVGLVDTVAEFEHPEFFFPLKRLTLRRETRTLTPIFNSALLLPLTPAHAHAVQSVHTGPRFSITTLYGDR